MSDSKTSSHYRRTSYARVNRNAAKAKKLWPVYWEYLASKHPNARVDPDWWKHPDVWLGEEWLDLSYMSGYSKEQKLREFFKRLSNGKKNGGMTFSLIMKLAAEFPEFMALRRIYIVAEEYGRKGKFDKVKLTRRQRQALKAAEEALRMEFTDVTKYVGERLGITRQAASSLLSRASVRIELEILLFGELVQYIHRENVSTYETPSPDVVRRQMAKTPRQCAGAGMPQCEGTVRRGDMPLCWSCRQRFGIRGEWPSWLEYRVNDIEREHRQLALEALGFGELNEETEVLRAVA